MIKICKKFIIKKTISTLLQPEWSGASYNLFNNMEIFWENYSDLNEIETVKNKVYDQVLNSIYNDNITKSTHPDRERYDMHSDDAGGVSAGLSSFIENFDSVIEQKNYKADSNKTPIMSANNKRSLTRDILEDIFILRQDLTIHTSGKQFYKIKQILGTEYERYKYVVSDLMPDDRIYFLDESDLRWICYNDRDMKNIELSKDWQIVSQGCLQVLNPHKHAAIYDLE